MCMSESRDVAESIVDYCTATLTAIRSLALFEQHTDGEQIRQANIHMHEPCAEFNMLLHQLQ